MSERKRFVVLLVLAAASVALLLYVRHSVGANFTNQF